MIKFNDILHESVLTPRRSKEDREKNRKIAAQRQIQKYIKNGCEGNLNLNTFPLVDFPDGIHTIGGDLRMENSITVNLPNNLHIKKSLMLHNSHINKFPNKLKIDHDLHMDQSFIHFLPSDMVVGNTIFARHSSLEKWTGTKVGGDLYINYSPLACKTIKLIEIFCKKYDYDHRNDLHRLSYYEDRERSIQKELKKMFPGVDGSIIYYTP